MYSIIMVMVIPLPWHSTDRRTWIKGGWIIGMDERRGGLTDSHTVKMSSSQAEIRTHANDSADADRLCVFACVYLDIRHY